MTVLTTAASQTFEGNGTATSFPCAFRIFQASDITVTTIVEATGVATPQTLGAGYTVTGAGNSTGFTVVMATAPPTGTSVFVQRDLPYTQPTDFENQGAYYPTMQADVADRLEMQIQQLVATTIQLILSGGDFVWDAKGHRIINVGDAVLEGDAVNLGLLLQYIGGIGDLGLNVTPKIWRLTGDGATKKFYLAGADVQDETFYDVYEAGVGIEPVDGYTVAIDANTDNSSISFVTAPADDAVCWVILRGYAKPDGFSLINNQTFIDLVTSIIQDILNQNLISLGAVQANIPQATFAASETVDNTSRAYLLRGTSAISTTLTIRANDGDSIKDWSEDVAQASYFSVLQRGDGDISVVGDTGVTITVPEGYIAKPRTKGSVITLTGDNVSAGQWVCSGDMALST